MKSIRQVSLKPPDVEAGISVNRDLQEKPSVSGSETLQKISHFSYSFISVLMFQATDKSCQLTYSKIIANGSHSDRREMTSERTRNISKEGRVTEISNVWVDIIDYSSPNTVCWSFIYLFLFIYFLINLVLFFICLFLAVLGLRCCVQAFSSCGEQGLLFIAVHGLFTAVFSLVAEHGL